MTFDHPHLHHLIVLGDVRVEDRLPVRNGNPLLLEPLDLTGKWMETLNWEMDGNLP